MNNSTNTPAAPMTDQELAEIDGRAAPPNGQDRKPTAWITISEETGKRSGRSIAVGSETWNGNRLVRVSIDDRNSVEFGGTVWLRPAVAEYVGHAMINAGAGQPLMDEVDPWDHGDPPPVAEWLERTREELETPRAMSLGHKKTIYAARRLFAEIDRKSAAYQVVHDALISAIATEREACAKLLEAIASTYNGIDRSLVAAAALHEGASNIRARAHGL